MATMDELLEKVREIAEREQRPVEDVLTSMIEGHPMAHRRQPEATGDVAYEAAMHELRPKLYARARRYWQETGNTERLRLTDAELDEQFWLFDNDGIPRLKSDEGQFELAPDPFDKIIGLFSSDVTDLSTTVRETLEATTHPQYGWTTRDRTD